MELSCNPNAVWYFQCVIANLSSTILGLYWLAYYYSEYSGSIVVIVDYKRLLLLYRKVINQIIIENAIPPIKIINIPATFSSSNEVWPVVGFV